VLTDYLGWQSAQLVNVPIGLLVLILAPWVLTESRSDEDRGFDVAGAVSITTGLLALVYAFVAAAEHGWTAPMVLVCFGVAAALLSVFVAIEAHGRAPLVPLSTFRRRNLTGANMVMLLQTAAYFDTFYFLSLYLQQVLGYSALAAGLAYLPNDGQLHGRRTAGRQTRPTIAHHWWSGDSGHRPGPAEPNAAGWLLRRRHSRTVIDHRHWCNVCRPPHS
jgi:MFS family permease